MNTTNEPTPAAAPWLRLIFITGFALALAAISAGLANSIGLGVIVFAAVVVVGCSREVSPQFYRAQDAYAAQQRQRTPEQLARDRAQRVGRAFLWLGIPLLIIGAVVMFFTSILTGGILAIIGTLFVIAGAFKLP
jgi:uncharacterized membrane protein